MARATLFPSLQLFFCLVKLNTSYGCQKVQSVRRLTNSGFVKFLFAVYCRSLLLDEVNGACTLHGLFWCIFAAF